MLQNHDVIVENRKSSIKMFDALCWLCACIKVGNPTGKMTDCKYVA